MNIHLSLTRGYSPRRIVVKEEDPLLTRGLVLVVSACSFHYPDFIGVIVEFDNDGTWSLSDWRHWAHCVMCTIQDDPTLCGVKMKILGDPPLKVFYRVCPLFALCYSQYSNVTSPGVILQLVSALF